MDMYFKYTDAPRKIRKKLKNSKPYWNDKLYDLWCIANLEVNDILENS